MAGASEQAGEQAADGHRMWPGEVMRGERRAVRADGRWQGQPDAERRAIRVREPRRQQVGDQAQHGFRGGSAAGSGTSSTGPSTHPIVPARSAPSVACTCTARTVGASGWISTACDGRPVVGTPRIGAGGVAVRIRDRRLQFAQHQAGGRPGQPQLFGEIAAERRPMRVREGQRPGQRGAGPVRGGRSARSSPD